MIRSDLGLGIDGAALITTGGTSNFQVLHDASRFVRFLNTSSNSNLSGFNFLDDDGTTSNMIITNAGNVGIGTTEPATRLDISGGGIFFRNDDTIKKGRIYTTASDEADYDEEMVITFGEPGDNRSSIFIGPDSTGPGSPAGRIQFNAKKMIFMEGSVGIGTANPTMKLYVNGSAGGIGSWDGSDIRWKKNIQTIPAALERITKLRGVSYEWRKDEFKDKNFDKGKQLGLVAQEVEKVFPELIKDVDGYEHLSYNGLMAPVIEAIKELKSENNILKAENGALKSRVEALEAKLSAK
jgi:hypothetical protein